MKEFDRIEQLEKNVKSLETVAVFGIMLLVFAFGVFIGMVGLW